MAQELDQHVCQGADVNTAIKLVLIAAVVAGGIFGYKKYFGAPSEACAAYQAFAEALARAQYSKAKKLSTDQALEYVEEDSQPVMFMGRAVAHHATMTNSIAGDVTGVSYKIESETASDDGSEVDIAAVQSVYRYRPGARAVGGGTVARFRHTVHVRLEGSKWKVSSFEQEQVED